MNDAKTIMSWIEGLAEDDWRAYHSDSEVQNIAIATLEFLASKTIKEVVCCKDCKYVECEGANGKLVCDMTGFSHSPNYYCADGEKV